MQKFCNRYSGNRLYKVYELCVEPRSRMFVLKSRGVAAVMPLHAGEAAKPHNDAALAVRLWLPP